MTPPAATVAGRRSTGVRPARSSRLASGRPPRRVSGPARPTADRPVSSRPAPRPSGTARLARPAAALGSRVAAAAAAVALPQHAPRPSAPPRRRPTAVPRPARRPDLPLGARVLEGLRALPDHRLLDRLIGGRIWIVLLGTLLVGIVTLQLTLLRLNAGIGRAIEQSTALQQSNAALEAQVSQLSNGERVVAQATQMGYVWPPQGSPRYLTAGSADAAQALATMRVPNPTPAPPPASVSTSAVTAPAGAVSGAQTGTLPMPATGTGAGSQTTGTTGTIVAPQTAATATGAPAAAAPAPSASQTSAGGASAPVGG